MQKTAIILLPKNEKELKGKIQEIKEVAGSFSYEIVAVVDPQSMPTDEEYTLGFDLKSNIKLVLVPDNLASERKLNIARQVISDDVEYMLFLGMNTKLTNEWLVDRVRAYRTDPRWGIVGKFATETKPLSEKEETKLHLTLGQFIHLSLDDFKEKCCVEPGHELEGKFRYVEEENWSTRVKFWDLVGGLSTSSPFPYLEYNGRIQALGYTILPQPE